MLLSTEAVDQLLFSEFIMSEPDFIVDTKRHLPHKQLSDSVIFLTWRLAFTLPEAIQQKLAENRINHISASNSLSATEKLTAKDAFAVQQFTTFDNWIDKYAGTKHYISAEPYLSIIANTIMHDERKKYDVSAYCVMPNHVHLIIKPLPKNDGVYCTILEISEQIKSVTAHKINRVLGISGKFWQHESYDRVIRDETEYLKTVEYVINNPVKSGLVDKWEEWQGTYLCQELR